jgi:hypothetical protein
MAIGPTEVLVGYGGLALSSAFVILAVFGVLRGRKPVWRSFAAVPLAVGLAFLSHAWLTDTWRSWRQDRCFEGASAYCNTAADARPPLWPF